MEKITNIKVWNAIDERIDRVVEMFELRNEELENRIKELENNNINNIIKRVENIEIIISSNQSGEKCIIKRLEELERDVISIGEGEIGMKTESLFLDRFDSMELNNKIDDLESKNYQLKAYLDKIEPQKEVK